MSSNFLTQFSRRLSKPWIWSCLWICLRLQSYTDVTCSSPANHLSLSIGANSLKYDWSGDNVKWCFPPKNLMYKVFKKIENSPSLNLIHIFLKTNGDTIFKLFLEGDGKFKCYVKKCLICDSRVFSPFLQSRFMVSNHTWYILHIVKSVKLFDCSARDIIKI